jgi:O-antigen ligase
LRFRDSERTTPSNGAADAERAPARDLDPEPVSTALGTALRWSPLGLALGVFAIWAARDGGYAPVHWLPGTLFVLGLMVVVVLAEGPPFAARRGLAVASLLFAAYTAWSFLSITWADVKGDAWDGANRTLLYLCTFVLFAWRPIPARVSTVLLGAFVSVTVTIATVDFLRATRSVRPDDFFIVGRLASPISYPNANAALFLAPFLPAIFLASRRTVPIVVRAVMLAAAGLLLDLAILCQSRATLLAVPLVVLGFLAICPGRLRLLPSLAAVTVPAALSTRTLLDVFPAVSKGHNVRAALVDARSVMAWTAVALLVVGAAIALVDRQVRFPRPATRAVGWVVAAAAAVAAVAGPVFLVEHYGDPAGHVRSAWHHFKSAKSTATTNHLASGFSSPRYDLWRVALDEFKASPIHGVGVDNFAVDYLRLRRTADEPVHPHSLELRVIAQTGLVGAALFGGFLALALLAVAQALRRQGPAVGGLAVASLSVFAYWLVHGSVDWFWEVPALGAPAFAFLAVAAQTVAREPVRTRPRLSVFREVPVVLIALAAAAGLTFPWLAAKEVDSAAAEWSADPAAAFHSLDLARGLNPLTDRADLIAGVIASRLRDRQRERAAFDRVLERNPKDWYARFELALLDAQEGKKAAALSGLAQVRRLNPREPLIPLVRAEIRKGEHVSQATIDRYFRARTATLTGLRQR